MGQAAGLTDGSTERDGGWLSLIRRAAAGDEPAIEELRAKLHAPAMRAAARALGGAPASCMGPEDLASMAVTHVLLNVVARGLVRFEGPDANPRAYLTSCAINQVFRLLGRRRHEVDTVGFDDMPAGFEPADAGSGDAADAVTTRLVLQGALRLLRPDQRLLLLLVANGHTYEEIAIVLGMDPRAAGVEGRIRVRVCRARKALRGYLGDTF